MSTTLTTRCTYCQASLTRLGATSMWQSEAAGFCCPAAPDLGPYSHRTHSTEAPTQGARITKTSETLTVEVAVDLIGFGQMRFAHGSSKFTPNAAQVTVTHGPTGNRLEVSIRGVSDSGLGRHCYWSSPYATQAPDHDTSDPLVGYASEIPSPVLDALEAATGISFADYAPAPAKVAG